MEKNQKWLLKINSNWGAGKKAAKEEQKAAIEAMKDQAFVNKAKSHNNKWKPYIEKQLNQIGLITIPGVANFVLVKFKNEKQANSCYAFLEKNNIYVRKIAEYGLPNFLRITVGLKSENIILCKLIFIVKISFPCILMISGYIRSFDKTDSICSGPSKKLYFTLTFVC